MLSASIVIVSYGSAAYLPECLASLYKNLDRYPAATATLVENNPEQAALEATGRAVGPFLAKGLRYRPAPANLGYGGGANWGWQQSGEADVYLVLNPDMEFPDGWLAAFLAPFERDPLTGVSGCKLLAAGGTIQHAGGLLRRDLALAEHFGAGEPDDGRWDESGEVEFVTGAALGLSRAAYAALGGFDPAFSPGYYEDVDLCRRARAAGFKVWYEAGATAWHYEGGAFGRQENYYRILHRNRLRYVLKHYSTAQLLGEFLPAERARLQGELAGPDRQASAAIYRAALRSFLTS